MRWLRIAAALVLSSVLLASCADTSPDETVPNPSEDVPTLPAINVSTKEMWDALETLDPGTKRVAVGLKNDASSPVDAPLTDIAPQLFEATVADLLKEVHGVSPASSVNVGRIPLASQNASNVFIASVDSAAALQSLSDHTMVQFVEPYYVDLALADSLSCGADPWTSQAHSRAGDSWLPPQLDGPGDLVPYNYGHHAVQRAWHRLELAGLRPGANTTVAVLDTGLSRRQEQFGSRFAVATPRRQPLVLNTVPIGIIDIISGGVDDHCSHGTKVASVAAAPKDGRSIVGVGWAADLISTRVVFTPHATKASVGSICDGIRLAVTPPDGGPPARVVAMAFALTYWSPTIAGCIQAAYDASPNTLFVAAAGSQVTQVMFPANMDCCVTAVSLVELTDDGYRLMGRPLTVSYGPSVDFVSVSTTGGIPASGLIGNGSVDEIAKFSWSSAATGTYAGLFTVASAYAAAAGWDRSRLMAVLAGCASRRAVTDFSGEPAEAVIGYGILDLYCVVGGIQGVQIVGSGESNGGDAHFSVDTSSGAPLDLVDAGQFRYEWSIDGHPAGHERQVHLSGLTNGAHRVTVSVTDAVDGTIFTADRALMVRAPNDNVTIGIRTLRWSSYVADWATFLNGGRHDRVVLARPLAMAPGCRVVSVVGLLVDSSGRAEPGQSPAVSVDAGNRGFSVSREADLRANELETTIHQWHDGFSAVRTTVIYDVEEPHGVDCSIPGLLTDA